MTHDPLCPWKPQVIGSTDGQAAAPAVACACDLIAKLREDMLSKCITLIEESPWSSGNWHAVDERAAILTALRALPEKP